MNLSQAIPVVSYNKCGEAPQVLTKNKEFESYFTYNNKNYYYKLRESAGFTTRKLIDFYKNDHHKNLTFLATIAYTKNAFPGCCSGSTINYIDLTRCKNCNLKDLRGVCKAFTYHLQTFGEILIAVDKTKVEYTKHVTFVKLGDGNGRIS